MAQEEIIFPNNIRNVRLKRGMKMTELSRRANLSLSAVSKIEKGVLIACRKRPVSAAQISKVVDEIETEIFSLEEKEIPSTKIGEIVMGHLEAVDPVAYVRFASVYREFKDVNTFMDELKRVLDK